ncbi:ATP-binding protein [Aeoliella mucimassa]|uniref:AAA+ ATPase domain-containing protein n=1 Tax=Aeoliella mucimassa TaxID=2527972 RepID=A0A518AK48_9BACT|nr:hypothetical protein [Aeoliella mucimassa]QDU55095.1 hypothetical protein Pan181_12810 [Aeoliella mucimassa]
MHTLEHAENLLAEEQAIVQMAAKNRGAFEIANRSDTRGPAIRSGNDKLFDPANPTYAMQCLEAIPHLIEMQLVRQAGGPKRFELTNFGWQLSRNLTAKQEEELAMTAARPTAAEVAPVGNIQMTSPIGRPATEPPPAASPLEAVEDCTIPRSEEAVSESPTMPPVAAPDPDFDPPVPMAGPSPSTTLAPSAIPSAPTPGPSATPPDFGGKAKTTDKSLVAALGLDNGFLPPEPRSLEETGLSGAVIEDLILKVVQNAGSMTGRQVAELICLPLPILEDRFTVLRNRQHIAPTGSAMLGDYVYQLTDKGRERARLAMQDSAYTGPAPVPLEDYVDSVEAQTIRSEKPKRPQLEEAFSDINVEPEMLAQLGPAISAGKGMFIYGPPGNGKTTVAQRITRCFGQNILIPYAIIEDGQIIKLYDAACHERVGSQLSNLLKTHEHDQRWVRIRRPTVVVGGELTMDSLELKHDPVSHISEASLQLKSNCGSLLIDDFGRQRVNPTELLNRWIVPLENRIDYLSLANGKKIQVPFEQLIIFSTNLEPHDLADDAFLRRIPFKIEVGAPSREEFVKLFGIFSKKLKVSCPPDALEYLLARHYESCNRPLRRCQARDLLDQALHYCEYNEIPPVATPEILDHAVNNYFTAMAGTE